MTEINWKTTKEDGTLLVEIVDRAVTFWPKGNRMNLLMDLNACHSNGCPLRLADLLSADDFNFTHDVGGISRGINRDTGKLEGFFVPRFALRQS
jgi:hypothetical protein